MTWLSTSSLAVPLSPYQTATSTVGMMASRRVEIRRSHDGNRSRRNPSMTTWPARVAVTVEFCPEAKSATANSVLASGAPRIGASSM